MDQDRHHLLDLAVVIDHHQVLHHPVNTHATASSKIMVMLEFFVISSVVCSYESNQGCGPQVKGNEVLMVHKERKGVSDGLAGWLAGSPLQLQCSSLPPLHQFVSESPDYAGRQWGRVLGRHTSTTTSSAVSSTLLAKHPCCLHFVQLYSRIDRVSRIENGAWCARLV